MVQYIVTPWMYRHELLDVREQFYPGIPGHAGDGVKEAIRRVLMWTERGNCPCIVESTALLWSAILDEERDDGSATVHYTIKSAYTTALIRFVTGVLDGHQGKRRKESMFSVARRVGLPAVFVELRHAASHQGFPGLDKLRDAAQQALVWIWDYYWKGVDPDGGAPGERSNRCHEAVLDFLEKAGDGLRLDTPKEAIRDLMHKWGEKRLCETLDAIQTTARESRDAPQLLRVILLQRRIRNKGNPLLPLEHRVGDLEQIVVELAQMRRESDEAESQQAEPDDASEEGPWVLLKGPWSPRPIGEV